MKIKKVVLLLPLFTAVIFPLLAFADIQPPPEGQPITSAQDIYDLLNRIFTIVRTIFFILAVVFLIFAAFRYLTAQGDEEKLKGAKNMFIYSIVAIAIALIAMGITALINNILTR